MTSLNFEPKIEITPQDSNPEVNDVPFGVGHIELSRGLSDWPLHQELVKLRKDFVVRRGWREPEDEEWDRYDDDPLSLHIAMRKEIGSPLEMGVRLTPIADVASSLTWADMLSNNPQMRSEAQQHVLVDGANTLEALDATAARGNLYDLTRLASDDSSDPRHLGAIMELIGVAAGIVEKQTNPEQFDDIKYIFLTTPQIKYVLKLLEVNVTTITSGKVNEGDNEKSYLCIIEQEKTQRHIIENSDKLPQSYPHLVNGLKKANAL